MKLTYKLQQGGGMPAFVSYTNVPRPQPTAPYSTSDAKQATGEESEGGFGLLDKNNHVQRNNSNGVQTYQTASGGAGYTTNQLVQSGMRRTLSFSLKDVTVAATGEVQLKLDGIIPFARLPASVRVKSIEFYCNKSITGGSLSATVRAWTAAGTTGTNMISSSMTATIPVNQQDKSATNAMNSSADRILVSSKFYVGVDFNNTVVNGGGTVDLLCNLVLDYSDDWRFEVAL